MKPTYPNVTVIIGSGRSGTSFLGRALFHSIGFCHGLGEPKFVVPVSRQLDRFGDLSDLKNMRQFAMFIHNRAFPTRWRDVELNGRKSSPQDLLDRVIHNSYTGILYASLQLMADKRGARLLGYKDPIDIVNLPVLSQLLPTAHFVHIVRDGRDVAASFRKFDWGPANLYSGIQYWTKTTEKGHHDGLTLGNRYFSLRLEDLILDTEETAFNLISFIMRQSDPVRSQKFIDYLQANKNTSSMYRWKSTLTSRQRRLCESIAYDVLHTFGYELESETRPQISLLTRVFYRMADVGIRIKNRLQRIISDNSDRKL